MRQHPERRGPQASIFYTAYTRDDLPKADRPVTFFFNGGPGSASIWLHLGVLGAAASDSLQCSEKYRKIQEHETTAI